MSINPSTSTRFELFMESLTPKERDMKERLSGYLVANNMEMPTEQKLKSEVGISAVFIAKMQCCLEDCDLLKSFKLSSEEELKATRKLVDYKRPLYKRRIARAKLEDTLSAKELSESRAYHQAMVEEIMAHYDLMAPAEQDAFRLKLLSEGVAKEALNKGGAE